MKNSKLFQILIVDDERDIGELLAAEFPKSKYEVHIACQYTEAIELLSSLPFNILITDLRLQGDSGWDLIESAQKLPTPPSLIYLLTASDLSPMDMEKEGIDKIFCKPFDPWGVVQHIDKQIPNGGLK